MMITHDAGTPFCVYYAWRKTWADFKFYGSDGLGSSSLGALLIILFCFLLEAGQVGEGPLFGILRQLVSLFETLDVHIVK